MPKPQVIKMTQMELDALTSRLENNALTFQDRALLKEVLQSHSWLYRMLESSKISLSRLKYLLFGEKSEKRDKKSKPSNLGTEESDPEPANDVGVDLPPEESDPNTPKGHGRYGVSDYVNREQVPIVHPALKPGDSCPENLCSGKLYSFRPGSFIRVMGQPMAKVIECVVQKLRCSTCTKIFSAPIPDHIPKERYDIPFKSLLVLNRFFLAVPYYRQADFHDLCGVPLAESTQWGLIQQVAGVLIPVYKQLQRRAAQARLIYGDDTVFKILSLIEQNKRESVERTGMFTTCLLAQAEQLIVLFYIGRKHLGENLTDLMKLRKPGLSPMLQMCDAKSCNIIEHDNIIVCHCLAHARRKFCEIEDHFPQECAVILDLFSAVYHQECISKNQGHSPERRLQHHQQNSQPILSKLYSHMSDLIVQRKVEPNSALGKAIAYNLKHWTQLTRFLQLPGAPLDNNFCEQTLKLPIRNRKNSLFFKNEYSAKMSSIVMSVIYTCKLNNINPLDYLNTLQYHQTEVRENPSAWLPWNYHDVALKKAA